MPLKGYLWRYIQRRRLRDSPEVIQTEQHKRTLVNAEVRIREIEALSKDAEHTRRMRIASDPIWKELYSQFGFEDMEVDVNAYIKHVPGVHKGKRKKGPKNDGLKKQRKTGKAKPGVHAGRKRIPGKNEKGS